MNAEAETIIRRLRLVPHPEGGFYRETFRAAFQVRSRNHSGPRSASTAIYFLLPAGSFSAFHRVRGSDEIWHFYQGDPLELHLLDASGLRSIRLGCNLAAGEEPQAVVPAGALQAAAPLGSGYTLCGCTVAPGFDFADFELPGRHQLVAQFAQHRTLIERFTRPTG